MIMAGGMKMYGKHRFPGRLFIVEGIDGSGKSTQLSLLQKWLEAEGYVVYFSETFAGNAAGWTLGPEWQIGPAMASVGLPTGNQDPAETKEPTQEQPEPAAIYTKSALVTVEDVVAFGSGPGTDALQGVVESTDVFKILRDEL